MIEYNAFCMELADEIAHIQINRPNKINAINQDFWREIVEIFRRIDDTGEVWVVVLSGAGKHFSSGIDLMLLAQVSSQLGRDVGRNADTLRRKILELQASFNVVDNCRELVLTVIQGYYLGGAIDLVSACGIRHSTVDMQFSVKEIDIGTVADVGTLQRLPWIIGDGMMRELAYTGRMADGEEAWSISLINRAYVDQVTLMDEVFELAWQIAARSPIAVRGTKEMIRCMRGHWVDDGFEYVATRSVAVFQPTDLQMVMVAHMARQESEFADWCRYIFLRGRYTRSMVTGTTSLSLMRDELFTTMEQVEQGPEQFVTERQNDSLLQHVAECLQQICGTLNLIELTGAELLAQEALQLVTDVPTGVGEERDGQLAALGNILYVPRRYLENVGVDRQEIPELLLPAVSEVRCAAGQSALPGSFFFSARLDTLRLPSTAIDHLPFEAELGEEGQRMRHMYQVNLLGLIREQNLYPSLELTSHVLMRLDSLYGGVARSRLCRIGATAIESIVGGQLLPRKSYGQLLSCIDHELKQLLIGPAYKASHHLLKELLYLMALSNGQGPRSREIRELHGLASLPFTDHLLEEESQCLPGPSQSVMRSLSVVIREELVGAKDVPNLIKRGMAQPDSLTNLHAQPGKLNKTLGMVGLNPAGIALQTQLLTTTTWVTSGVTDSPPALPRLADTVLYVGSMVGNLERSERRIARPAPVGLGQEADVFAMHQLVEVHIVVIEEAKVGLALARRAIAAYLESNGDKFNLASVPTSPQTVRGDLWFLGQERIALPVSGCVDYIQWRMTETAQMSSEQMLETLADALTSLEYYLEGGAVLRPQGWPDVLDLASVSVKALGLPVTA